MISRHHTTHDRQISSGGIAVRSLTEADLPAAMRLKTLCGWNQTETDWRLFIDGDPHGCFAAVRNGMVVGTSATIRYDERVAWIGMVLVDPEMRRMGIGQTLLNAALESLQDVPTVKLDATPEGKKLYDTLGFADESTLHRWTRPAAPLAHSADLDVRATTENDLLKIIALDEKSFGAKRERLLTALWKNAPRNAFCIERDGEIAGFCLGREGTKYFQIGPLVAENAEVARALATAACAASCGCALVIDACDAQSDFVNLLQEMGFVSERPFIRMRRGDASPADVAKLYAICGPEFG